jgi:hypothetical protein
MRVLSLALFVSLGLAVGHAVTGINAYAQADRRIVLKAGETVELKTVYWVSNCKSIMIGLPEIEVLEGPSQVTLSVKESMVLPRRQNCANRVPGGILTATAKDYRNPWKPRSPIG